MSIEHQVLERAESCNFPYSRSERNVQTAGDFRLAYDDGFSVDVLFPPASQGSVWARLELNWGGFETPDAYAAVLSRFMTARDLLAAKGYKGKLDAGNVKHNLWAYDYDFRLKNLASIDRILADFTFS